MDFTFSDDQDALRDAVRAFLANEAGRDYVRAMADDERGFTDELWDKLAEHGLARPARARGRTAASVSASSTWSW